MYRLIEEVDKVVEGVVGVVEQQVALLHVAEDASITIQTSQVHGLGLPKGLHIRIGVRQQA